MAGHFQQNAGFNFSLFACVLFSRENIQTNSVIDFMARVNRHNLIEEIRRLGYVAGCTYMKKHEDLRRVVCSVGPWFETVFAAIRELLRVLSDEQMNNFHDEYSRGREYLCMDDFEMIVRQEWADVNRENEMVKGNIRHRHWMIARKLESICGELFSIITCAQDAMRS